MSDRLILVDRGGVSGAAVVQARDSDLSVGVSLGRAGDRLISAIDGAAIAEAFGLGFGLGSVPRSVRAVIADMRGLWGFRSVSSDLLTSPTSQHKLGAESIASYGLTLHHHRFLSRVGHAANLCPWAGACAVGCVLNNGNGRYSSVQRAWGWRTDLLLHRPTAFGVALGAELRRAVDRHGRILVRPNVNSDIPWHLVAPSIVDGSAIAQVLSDPSRVLFYDYSKRPSALLGNGWAARFYRVAASASEHVSDDQIAACLAAGGSVAVVTDRRRRQSVRQWHPSALVVNADATDAWMFQGGVIGDLSWKPRDRSVDQHGRRSGFVRSVGYS